MVLRPPGDAVVPMVRVRPLSSRVGIHVVGSSVLPIRSPVTVAGVSARARFALFALVVPRAVAFNWE
jgi:hypothetical protein